MERLTQDRPGEPRRGVTRCRGCGGWAASGAGGRSPAGWYGLTVAVPPELDQRRGYIWVGQFCSVGCLASSVPDLRAQEELAHEAYEPVRPVTL